MAGIPLFDPQYLASPTMFGSVSNLTANIMADAGKQLSKKIEDNAQQFEAEQKAPQIAQLMGQGLTLLSKGDTSGFNYLAQAHATGATNPFLANMTKSALDEGSRVYNSHISEESATSRFKLTSTAEDKRFKQSLVINKLTENQRTNLANDNDYDNALKKYQADEIDRQALRARGMNVPQVDPPKKPEKLPTTVGDIYKQNGMDALFGTDTGLPTSDKPADTFGGPGVGPTTAAPATNTPVTQNLPNTSVPSPTEPLVNETSQAEVKTMMQEAMKKGGIAAANVVAQKFGLPSLKESDVNPSKADDTKVDVIDLGKRLKLHIAEPPPVADSVSIGKYVFKKDPKNDPGTLVAEFKKAISGAKENGLAFVEQAGDLMAEGKKVTVEPSAGDSKGKEPYTVMVDGKPLQIENPNAAKDKNAPSTIPMTVNAKLGNLWQQAQGLLEGSSVKRYVQSEVVPPSEEDKSAMQDKYRDTLKQVIMNSPDRFAAMKQANKSLESAKIDKPFTIDDIPMTEEQKHLANVSAAMEKSGKKPVTKDDLQLPVVKFFKELPGKIVDLMSGDWDKPDVIRKRLSLFQEDLDKYLKTDKPSAHAVSVLTRRIETEKKLLDQKTKELEQAAQQQNEAVRLQAEEKSLREKVLQNQ